MNVEKAYNSWAQQYDSNENKTRDLEAVAMREILSKVQFTTCLEFGCGTGKNTGWLLERSKHVTAVDLSGEMLLRAKEKFKTAGGIKFFQADITKPWTFIDNKFDLATFSLMLEHIEDLDTIFSRLSEVMVAGAHVYIGELHPFKQYAGSKARFENEEGLTVVTCFTHNISDFTSAAINHGFSLLQLNEYFDNDDRSSAPRILTLLLRKDR